MVNAEWLIFAAPQLGQIASGSVIPGTIPVNHCELSRTGHPAAEEKGRNYLFVHFGWLRHPKCTNCSGSPPLGAGLGVGEALRA